MTAPVKGRAPKGRSRVTRQRIVSAATELFLAEGYGATTLESIADRAGVAVQTVYFHFHNKRTVLKEVTDQLATGDDEAVALLERPWMQQMHEAPDAEGAVGVWCSLASEVFGRVARIRWMAVTASANDADLAAQERINREQTLASHRVLAEHLDERGALREDLTVEAAGEVLYGLSSLELYVLFTMELGWSSQRWEAWVVDVVMRTVLTSRSGRR